jgi:hypothetical protein
MAYREEPPLVKLSRACSAVANTKVHYHEDGGKYTFLRDLEEELFASIESMIRGLDEDIENLNKTTSMTRAIRYFPELRGALHQMIEAWLPFMERLNAPPPDLSKGGEFFNPDLSDLMHAHQKLYWCVFSILTIARDDLSMSLKR